MQRSLSNIPKEVFLFFSISLLFCFHLLGFSGHYGYDDMEYAQIANGLLNGNFPIDNHFAYRFTLIFPTALFYLVFGLNDFGSLFSILLASSGVLYFVYLFCKSYSRSTLLLALGITLSFEYYLVYSNKLMPDIHVCLAFIAAIYFIYKQYFIKRADLSNALGLSISLMYGFLSKGTILLILPLLLYFLIVDLRKRENFAFWIRAAFKGIIFLAIYFLGIYLISGNASQRFDAILANSYLSRCSYDTQSLKILIYRISFDFLNLLKFSDLIIPTALVFTYILTNLKAGILKVKTKSHFLIISFLLLLVSSNFMSISYKSYHPMCLDIRHFLYLFPFAAIALALVFSEKIKFKNWYAFMTTAALAYLYFTKSDDFFTYQIPLAIAILLIIYGKKAIKEIGGFALLIVLLINPILMIEGAQKVNYKKQKKLTKKEVLSNSKPIYVISDPVAARIGNYWNSFDSSKAIFTPYNEFSREQFNEDRELLLMQNYATRFLSFYEAANYPFPVKASLEKEALFADSSLGYSIYTIENWKTPLEDGELIFSSSNNFEKNPDVWTGKKEANQEEIVYEGNYSNWVHEYSPTLRLHSDSLDLEGFEKLYIELQLAAYAEEKLEGQLILNIKKGDKNILYESRKIHPFIKSYSKWWMVETNYTIKISSIASDSEFLIYVWNSDKKKLLIDDFEIKFIGL